MSDDRREPEPHRFDRDTHVTPAERGPQDDAATAVFDARIDPGWWIVAGPNGGYLAAILLRSMIEAVGDASREPRSQTTHFTARPQLGPARLVVRVERSGRSLSTVTARLEQEGHLVALSVGALGTKREGDGPSFQEVHMPEVPPPASVPPRPVEEGPSFAFRGRYELRPVFGLGDPAPEAPAVTGGWIRPVGPRAGDAPLVAALCDAWPPAVFRKLGAAEGSRGVPTVELTVHFRAPDVVRRLAPDAHYLVRFATRMARDGFVEEDGEIWSETGTLLAQSRQLALLV